MINDFTVIDAQDEVSRMAQMSPEEQAEANAYYDELRAEQEKIDSKPRVNHNLNAWRHWGNMMSLLRSIHSEIDPILAARRQAEDNMFRHVTAS